MSVRGKLDEIDKTSYEIKTTAESSESPIASIEELIEELPDTTPRYIVLSYPLTLDDGRKKSPLVLIYWLPPTATQSSRMLYAAALELIREKAGVSKYVPSLLSSIKREHEGLLTRKQQVDRI